MVIFSVVIFSPLELLDFTLFGKTSLAANNKFGLVWHHPLRNELFFAELGINVNPRLSRTAGCF